MITLLLHPLMACPQCACAACGGKSAWCVGSTLVPCKTCDARGHSSLPCRVCGGERVIENRLASRRRHRVTLGPGADPGSWQVIGLEVDGVEQDATDWPRLKRHAGLLADQVALDAAQRRLGAAVRAMDLATGVLADRRGTLHPETKMALRGVVSELRAAAGGA